MIRLPPELFETLEIDKFIGFTSSARTYRFKENVILDVMNHDEDDDDFPPLGYEWAYNRDWMSDLLPLRSELIQGDLKLF